MLQWPSVQIWGESPNIYFHRIDPLGQFDLVVTMSVCCYLSPFHVLDFEAYFAPTFRSRMSKIVRDSKSLGKSAGKKWSQNWTFLLGSGLKLPRKKSYFFCWFCLTKHGGNHASRWIRDLWSKDLWIILPYLSTFLSFSVLDYFFLFIYFFFLVFVYSCSTLLWYWCYHLHWSRDLMSPICGIFFTNSFGFITGLRWKNVAIALVFLSAVAML